MLSGETAGCFYSYTGSEDTFTVPAGGSSLNVMASGAPGGGGTQGDGAGGLGAQVTASLPVGPSGVASGTRLRVIVGIMWIVTRALSNDD